LTIKQQAAALQLSYIFSIVGHFTFWISLSLRPKTTYTHRPQGANYRE